MSLQMPRFVLKTIVTRVQSTRLPKGEDLRNTEAVGSPKTIERERDRVYAL